MALDISTSAINEKNRLSSGDPWLLLLEINYPNESPIYLAWNTKDVVWDGNTWQAADFKLGDQEESKDGSVPTVSLGIVDIERRLIPIIDEYGGGVGAEVIVRIVHSSYLDNTIPEYEADLEIISTTIDNQSVVNFELGAENLTNHRSPPDMYLKLHCRYAEFKGDLCGYTGTATDCDRTWTRCMELNNQKRFGGFPALGRLGIFT